MLAQLAYATRGSLQIGVLVGILATVAVRVLRHRTAATAAAWSTRRSPCCRNVFLVIPGLPLVIVIAAFVPRESRGLWTIVVVLAITGWAASARVLRAQTLSLRNRDYVAAARVAGEKPWRVIVVEILPNLLPLIASQFVFAVIAAILSEAGLSFLGLGASNSSTLGTMLYYAQNGFALQLGAWWWFVPPGLMHRAVRHAASSLINFSIDEIINPQAARHRSTPQVPPGAELPTRPGRARADAARRPSNGRTHGARPSTVLDARDLRRDEVDRRCTRSATSRSTLHRGEILGLAGESGCGKSTLAYAINRLHRPPGRITSGRSSSTTSDGDDIDVLALDRRRAAARSAGRNSPWSSRAR